MISRLRALWNNVFRRKQLDRDLDEELQAYVELVSAEKVQAGVDPEEAHRDARREMGGVHQVIQHVRDVRAGVSLDRLVQMFSTVFERSRRILLSPWLRWPLWPLGSAQTRRCSACWIRLF